MALIEGRVPAAPVYDIAQALDADFAHEQDRIMDFHHPQHGPIKGIASPVRVAGATHPTEAAPALGEDTNDLLSELGYAPERVSELHKRGVIG
jgi:crotonobetainyl-CoA:carnitine CoA-transferase CaiB-like acyl-CoA transferase